MMAADAVRCMERNGGGEVGGDAIQWSDTDKASRIDILDNGFVATTAFANSSGVGADTQSAQSAGKHYAEFHVLSGAGLGELTVGFAAPGISRTGSAYSIPTAFAYNRNGYGIVDGAFTTLGYPAWGVGDVISVAVDFDAGTYEFYRNGAGNGIESSTFSQPGYTLMANFLLVNRRTGPPRNRSSRYGIPNSSWLLCVER